MINLISQIDSVLLFSDNAKKLAGFYRDKVGLKVTFEGVVGENNEEFYDFSFGKDAGFGIMDHSKVRGANKQPEKYMINFEVDDIKKEVSRLKRLKVPLKQDIYHVEGYGYIATFKDPDGNYFQLVQVRPTQKEKK